MENVSEKLPFMNNQFLEEQSGLTSIILLFFINTTQTLLTVANRQALAAADEVFQEKQGVCDWLRGDADNSSQHHCRLIG